MANNASLHLGLLSAAIILMEPPRFQWSAEGTGPVPRSRGGEHRRGRVVGRDGGRIDGRPGRNQPCPCGSGKKVKKCCGDAAEG